LSQSATLEEKPWPYVGGKPFYTLDRCKESASRFETRTQWAKGDRGAYDAAYRNKWIEECCGHMRLELRRRSLDEVKAIARLYATKWAWERGDGASYAAARRHGWLAECCEHMAGLTAEERAMLAAEPPGEPEQWKSLLPPPKNGKWPVFMLVGGPADLFRKTQVKWGAAKGVELKYHWDYEKRRQFDGPIPHDVDLVVVFKDILGHEESSKARKAAKKAGVRILITSSQKTAWEHAFYKMGIKNSEALPFYKTGLKETPALMPSAPAVIPVAPFVRRASQPTELKVAPAPPPAAPVVQAPVKPPTSPPVERERAEALFLEQAPAPTPAPKPAELLKAAVETAAPTLLEPRPLPPRPSPPVNIVVTQQSVPTSALPQRRPGVPRPETAAMIAALQAMCVEDQISVIIEPTGFQVSAVK
jgi:hypothetical protein